MSQEETKPLTKEQESAREIAVKEYLDQHTPITHAWKHSAFCAGYEAALKHRAEHTVAGELESFSEIVFMGLGEASMCWTEIPKGVFDSTKAKGIGDRILAAHTAQFNKDRERLARAEKDKGMPWEDYLWERDKLIEAHTKETEKLKSELAEKDALLVAKDNELCRALSEVKPLKLAIKQFKVWGTDGCRGKDDTCQGRLTLFIKSDKCLDCEYKTQGGVE